MKDWSNEKKKRFSKQDFLHIAMFSTILAIVIGILPALHSQPYWAVGSFKAPGPWQFIHNNPFIRNFEPTTISIWVTAIISTGLILLISITLAGFHKKLLSNDKEKLAAKIMHGALFFVAYPSAIACIVYSFREQNHKWTERNNPWGWTEEEAKKARKYATVYIRYVCVFTLIATARMIVYSLKFICLPEECPSDDQHNKQPSWFSKQYFLHIVLFDSFLLLITTILPWALSYKGVVPYWFYFHENRFFLGGCPNVTHVANEENMWERIHSCFSFQ